MWIKVSVTGADGKMTENAIDAQEEGELAAAIGAVLGDYRKVYPDSEPFDYTVKVSHA